MGTEPFVGRAAARGEIARLLGDATAGSGGLLLVAGPAGIGKTRLCEEATADVPAPVRWGRCVDDPGAPPLWPWRRVLDGLGVPEPDHAGDLLAARFRFVAAAADALIAAAEPDGLVLVLEDLHWADETSLRLLRHLSGELRRSRLAVLATYRDTEPGRLDAVLPDLLGRPGAHGITLPPLSEGEVREFLSHHGCPLDARHALRRSGGNPLYLRAIARSGDGLPLAHLVRSTVAALPAPVRELLEIAAVLGEEVDSTVLTGVSGVDDVAQALDHAVRAGVLVPVGAGLRRFAHAVVRDGIYAGLDPSVRESLHARAARALEERARRDPALAGVVAGHWLRAAADGPTLSRAADWARRAAGEATRSLAFAEAARFLGFACDALRRAGEVSRVPGLLIDLATAEYRAGRFRQAFEHAREAARERPDLAAAAALVVRDIAAPDLVPGLAELAATALGRLGADADPALRSRLLAQSASLAAETGNRAEATKLASEALALAEACGDAEALVDAVRARFKVWPIELPLPERLRLATLAIDLAARTDQPLLALWAHKWRLDAAFEAGTMTAVDAELSAISELARTTRLPLVRWHELRLRASVLAYRGAFAQARELDELATEVATTELAEDRTAVGMSFAFRHQLAQVTGDPGDIPDGGDDVLDEVPSLAIAVASRPVVELLRGRRAEAAARYEAVRPVVDRAFLAQNPATAFQLLPLAAEVGDREMAALVADHLATLPPVVSGGAGVFCSDAFVAWRARAAALLGRDADARRWFDEAIAIDTRTGARPYVVLNRLALAALVEPARAAVLAREALAEARRLGMPGAVRRASELLDRLRAADPLTAREREIAGLLAAALSNRAIAERLVLSERTVESHVRSILTKLGLANRTQIAEWARAAGVS
ncbi:hypothetical protein GCM10017786_03440 [Amycolatopsis deserti]|uniref:HTH luxR-type domain-containing protein n=1 Tax=Amycolatopsis deserti TaxID=185696 RepID=A0ABQ3IAX4_9PSEU|nr:AAA family ATPase [Amycolatopsis deserti]GHE77372.1 hypothetical protein GCM10017786_03440 [Amycolatopsis deserti]